jgi:RNA polymerase sigma-70 factor (ECF subfamily)
MKSPDDPAASLSDFELVRAARAGDSAAFSELVLQHQAAVRAFCAVRLGTVDEADDLAQEVFVTAHRRLGDFDPERPFGPWLRGIAANLVRGHRRKFRAEAMGGHAELQALVDARMESAFPEGRESQVLSALRECLEQLAGPSRALVLSRYGEGESVREITARLGRRHSAVTMQLHRIRQTLARCIQGRATEPLA